MNVSRANDDTRDFNGPAGWSARQFFFLKRNGHIGVGGKADFVAFDVSDQSGRDIVVVSLVTPAAALDPGQFDAVAIDMIDGADVHAIGTDDLGMFFYLGKIDHENSSSEGMMGTQRASAQLGAEAPHQGRRDDCTPINGACRAAVCDGDDRAGPTTGADRSGGLSPPDRGDDAGGSSNHSDGLCLGAPQLGRRKLSLFTPNRFSNPVSAGA